jgi:GT2 family glycosyltransferase/glycosyltransferase involved in cell wall biosynthesis
VSIRHRDDVASAREELAGAPSPVIVIPVYNGYEDVLRCYESVLAHSPAELTVLVVDDCGPDRRPVEAIDAMASGRQHVVVLHRATNGGFVRACNEAFAATAGRDVILVNSDIIVGPGWIEGLTAAAQSSSLIATVSSLTNHGTILSLPERNEPTSSLPDGMTPDEAAQRVADRSLRLRPTIPTAIGHCVYVKRIALDLVGGFDEVFGSGYGEEVDFCQRCVQVGLRHVCADDVFVYHRGGASFGSAATEQQHRNEHIVAERYPWYQGWVGRAAADTHAPLALALDQARMALVGARIGVDATSLGELWTGTQTVVLETIRALAPQVDELDTLVVFHTPSLTASVRAVLEELPVTLVDTSTIPARSGALVDVVYRPCQVNSLEELRWLRRHAARVVVNQLDVIAWSNPSYFRDERLWLDYRELTRVVLASVDGVAFISDFARREVEAEGLLPSDTPARVVYCGTSSVFEGPAALQSRPDGVAADERPFVLVIGASYHHKNRPFACSVLAELRRRGWDGRLVLAGPTPPNGNSLAEEDAMIAELDLAGLVDVMADVTEAEKNWLYAHAALTLYPTVSEGFGLVPFESARWDVPVLSSRQGSLAEVLPDDFPTLDCYDVIAAADLAWSLLHDDAARKANFLALLHRAGDFTWERTAAGALALAQDALRRSPSRLVAHWGEGGARGWPDGWTRTAPNVVDRVVLRLLRAEKVKRSAIPEGSRRQAYARRSINWLRKRAH